MRSEATQPRFAREEATPLVMRKRRVQRAIGRLLRQPSAKGIKAWCVVVCQTAENINDAVQGSRVSVLDIERATFEAIAA